MASCKDSPSVPRLATPARPTIIKPTLVGSRLEASDTDAYLSIEPCLFSYDITPSHVSPRVPIEVAEHIIDFLGDVTTRQHGALVCKSWFPRSRVNIWRTIVLSRLSQVYALCDVLEKTPEVRGLIRVLAVSSQRAVAVTNTALFIILPFVPRLHSIYMGHETRNLSPAASALISAHRNIRRLTLNVHSKSLIHTVRLLSQINSLEFLRLLPQGETEKGDVFSSRYDISSLARRCSPSLREIVVRTELCCFCSNLD